MDEDLRWKAAILTVQQIDVMLENPEETKYTEQELQDTRDNLMEYLKNE